VLFVSIYTKDEVVTFYDVTHQKSRAKTLACLPLYISIIYYDNKGLYNISV